jgi:hypothetical protein
VVKVNASAAKLALAIVPAARGRQSRAAIFTARPMLAMEMVEPGGSRSLFEVILHQERSTIRDEVEVLRSNDFPWPNLEGHFNNDTVYMYRLDKST